MEFLQVNIKLTNFRPQKSLFKESDASEEHRLAKDKKTFEAVDEIVTESSSHSYLSPITLTWALVRYLVSISHTTNSLLTSFF